MKPLAALLAGFGAVLACCGLAPVLLAAAAGASAAVLGVGGGLLAALVVLAFALRLTRRRRCDQPRGRLPAGR